jgi:hypothetical protein
MEIDASLPSGHEQPFPIAAEEAAISLAAGESFEYRQERQWYRMVSRPGQNFESVDEVREREVAPDDILALFKRYA